MTPDDTRKILELVTAGTGRIFKPIDLMLWHKILGRLDFQRCQDAVIRHFTEQPGVWIEPGHVSRMARTTTDGEADRNFDLDRACDHGTYCRECGLVHQPGRCGEGLMDRSGDMKELLRNVVFVMPELPPATDDLRGAPKPSVDKGAEVRAEAERARQLAEIARIAEAERGESGNDPDNDDQHTN